MSSKNLIPASVNYKYFPVGSSERLQRDISNHIAHLIANNNGATLEELGYLGSTVLADRGGNRLYVKLMFHPKLVAREMTNSHTSEKHFELDSALQNLSNYMFVGDVSSEYVSSYERCAVPKHHIEKVQQSEAESRKGVAGEKKIVAIHYDENGQVTKKTVEMDCIVITCNPNLVFASLVNTSLRDPNFGIHIEPVKRQAKVGRPDDSSKLVPAYVTVTRSAEDTDFHYDGNEAIPYLKSVAASSRTKEKTKRELSRKVRDEADHEEKKVKSAKNKTAKNKSKKLSKFSNI